MTQKIQSFTKKELNDLKSNNHFANEEFSQIFTESELREIFEQMLRHRKHDKKEDKTIHITEFKEIFKKQCRVELKLEDIKNLFNGRETVGFRDQIELMRQGSAINLEDDPMNTAYTPLTSNLGLHRVSSTQNHDKITKEKLKRFLEMDERFKDLSMSEFDDLYRMQMLDMGFEADELDKPFNQETFKRAVNVDRVENGVQQEKVKDVPKYDKDVSNEN